MDKTKHYNSVVEQLNTVVYLVSREELDVAVRSYVRKNRL